MDLILYRNRFHLFNIFSVIWLGVSLIPLSIIGIDINGTTGRSRITIKRYIYPRFVLGSDENGRELSIEAKGLLDKKGTNVLIPFSSIKMQWGYRRLGEYDTLISTCKTGEFYVAVHDWDKWYRLDNVKRITLSQDICSGNLKDGAKFIDMKFKKKENNGNEGEKDISKLKLTLNKCNFQWEDKNQNGVTGQRALKMICEGEINESMGRVTNGNGEYKEGDVVLTLGEEAYKLEYKPTKKTNK